MNKDSKNLLAQINIYAENTNPIFNYPSFIKDFDYYSTYIKVMMFLNMTNNENNINILFRELFKIIYNNSLSVRISLKIENQEKYHVCNPFIFPNPSKVCDLPGIFTKFNVVEISNCIHQEHLYKISSFSKDINQLNIYLRTNNDNYGISALINSFKIKVLNIYINNYFDFKTLPTRIFESIMNKLYCIEELEIELFRIFPIRILSNCKQLRKLKIIFIMEMFPDILKDMSEINIYESLENLQIIAADIGLETVEITNSKYIADSIRYIKNNPKLLKDLDKIKKLSDDFDYLKLIISKDFIILNLYSINLREMVQIQVNMKVDMIIYLKHFYSKSRIQQKLVRIVMESIRKFLENQIYITSTITFLI